MTAPMQDREARRAALLVVVAILSIAVLAAGLALLVKDVGQPVSASARGNRSEGSTTGTGIPPEGADRIEIEGADPEDPLTAVVRAAIAEVGAYWDDTYPELHGAPHPPVTRFRAVDPARDASVCGIDSTLISGNALYCGQDASIAYDTVGLFPRLRDQYGDLSIAFVIAHEWAHHTQAVSGRPSRAASVITFELQADCFAGAWLRHARSAVSYFPTDGEAIDTAVAGIVKEFKDPVGTDPDDPMALPHGNAFDRVDAVLDGFRSGADACATYDDARVRARLTLTPFLSLEDQLNEGNLPQEQTVGFTAATLEEYWNTEGVEALGPEVAEALAIEEGRPVSSCTAIVATHSAAGYCRTDDTVLVEAGGEVAELYRSFGDFAVSSYIAHADALGRLDRAGALGRLGATERVLLADCITGAYTAWMFDDSTPRESGSLSPGDLDEAVGMLLTTDGRDVPDGFERVDAFRRGFRSGIGGADGCRIPS